MSRFRRVSDVRFRHLGDETVVLRQRDAEVIVLNEVGGRVLELADGRDRDAIVEALLEEFAVGRQELERDVEGFLAALVGKRVLEIDDRGAGAEVER